MDKITYRPADHLKAGIEKMLEKFSSVNEAMNHMVSEYLKSQETPVVSRETVVMPFASMKFKIAWEKWKQYRLVEHKFFYQSHISEQAALDHLAETATHHEDWAIALIGNAIKNGWKGIFKPSAKSEMPAGLKNHLSIKNADKNVNYKRTGLETLPNLMNQITKSEI